MKQVQGVGDHLDTFGMFCDRRKAELKTKKVALLVNAPRKENARQIGKKTPLKRSIQRQDSSMKMVLSKPQLIHEGPKKSPFKISFIQIHQEKIHFCHVFIQ